MSSDERLLEALLDSWDRNNTIMVNLLLALPEGGLEARAMDGSPPVAEMFMHVHYVRLVFVSEDAPEFTRSLPETGWRAERAPGRIAALLNDSATAVRDAVKGKLEAGRDMDRHYDHPILMLQHMVWHEGYHHGQIKPALKRAGHPLDDEKAGPVTWDVWMNKTPKQGADGVRTLHRGELCSRQGKHERREAEHEKNTFALPSVFTHREDDHDAIPQSGSR